MTGERIRSWSDNASGTAEHRTHHYSGDEDSPSWPQETFKYLVDKPKPYLSRAFWWTVGKAKILTSNERVKRGLECGWSFHRLISNMRVSGYAGKIAAFIAGFIFGAISKWRCMPKGRYT
ncbi:hypothetical protein AB0873_13195 [Micromonospora sp. NPDC047707]|uniref:hypothetical protein n=1 Tax=Micromonospora sp. NPDC047707 TaxID=3154498 RepID=UPI0034561B1E